MAQLVNGLGGTAGFGEVNLAADQPWSASAVDLSGFYNASSGLKFLGSFYAGLWVNQSGFVQFQQDGDPPASTPLLPPTGGIVLGAGSATIAPFWLPVDTGRAPLPASPGGTSSGANRVWYDLDAATGTVTVTWDDVRGINFGGNGLVTPEGVNAFQLQIAPASAPGATSIDFDLTFRYESLEWGSIRYRNSNQFQTDSARALMTDFATTRGGAVVTTELPASTAALTDLDAIFDLATGSNVGEAGVWRFGYRQGWVTAEITVEDASVVEGSGPGTTFLAVPVRLEAGVPHAVTVTWTALGEGGEFGRANVATDLLATTGSITFDPWQREKTIFIPVARDTTEEALPIFGFLSESFTLQLSTAPAAFATPGGSVFRDATATLTIIEDDGPDFSGFSIADTSALEDSGALEFTVTRASGAGAGSVDYTAGAVSGTISFADGETEKVLRLAVQPDTRFEPMETVTVTLSNPVGQPILVGSATGSILNDDNEIIGYALPLQYEEPTLTDLAAELTFERRGPDIPNARSFTWQLVSRDGPNGSYFEMTGADFRDGVMPGGTLDFAAGQAVLKVTVWIAGDTLHELQELAFPIITSVLPSGYEWSSGAFGLRDYDTDLRWNRGTEGQDTRNGGALGDSIDGLGGDDVLRGLGGADVLHGAAGRDTLNGGDGADSLLGAAGEDVLSGEAGQDSLLGGAGADRLFGGTEADQLFGEAGRDTLRGEAGDDSLSGGEDADFANGDEGADTLEGGAGDDTLRGAADDDVLRGDTGLDLLLGEAGNDLLEGGDGRDRLQGGAGRDSLSGGSEADTLHGEAGDDLLAGDAGADLLRGGDGADTLDGGTGSDLMEGGAGPDVFRWLALEDSALSARDRIRDFAPGVDRLDVSAFGAMTFIGGADFSGGAGQAQIRVTQVNGNTLVWIDGEDADARPDFAVVLHGGPALGAADFIL